MHKTTGGGITRHGDSLSLGRWTIAGQDCRLMALEPSSFAFEIVIEPGQSVPTHRHPNQDAFILVQFGQLSVTLDSQEIQARPGDLVRLPRGLPHRHENRSSGTVKALFWVSPALKTAELFTAIEGLSDPQDILRIADAYGVDFTPSARQAPSQTASLEEVQHNDRP